VDLILERLKLDLNESKGIGCGVLDKNDSEIRYGIAR
jgi:hypothetical protein